MVTHAVHNISSLMVGDYMDRYKKEINVKRRKSYKIDRILFPMFAEVLLKKFFVQT